MKISVILPVYMGSHLIARSLTSLLSQDYDEFEILIGEDSGEINIEEREKTIAIVKNFNSDKLNLYINKKNLGYPVNLKYLVSCAVGDILFLFAQDDILAKGALKKIATIFSENENIGVITRPYFWFSKNIHLPIRAIYPPNANKDTIISLTKDVSKKNFFKIFESVGQLSGLAYRKKYLNHGFHNDVFPAHIYPFASILLRHDCVYLKDYIVAVGTEDSQTRKLSSIYESSPTESWLKMYDTIFSGEKYSKFRAWGYDHICRNYFGLIQIKCHARTSLFFKEILILLKNKPIIIIDPKFIFICVSLVILPKNLLRKLVDLYKSKINAKIIGNIHFNESI